jgi:hypothetical protein
MVWLNSKLFNVVVSGADVKQRRIKCEKDHEGCWKNSEEAFVSYMKFYIYITEIK